MMEQRLLHRRDIGVLLNRLGLTGNGVEVGVHTGRFAAQILQTWRGQTLWLVDPWRHLPDYFDSYNASTAVMERRYLRARLRLRAFEARTRWIRATSEVAAKRFEPTSLDFVYIDANHAYEHTYADLRTWYPKLRAGGLFSGHDYFDAIADERLEPSVFGSFPKELLVSYGVRTAVDELAAELGVTVECTLERYPTWYFTKPS